MEPYDAVSDRVKDAGTPPHRGTTPSNDDGRRGRFVRVAAAVLVCCLAAGSASATASAATQTFSPVADAYVSGASPTTNFGTMTTLKVDASPVVRSFLRFNVALPAGATISGATLQLYTTSASGGPGFQARAVSNVTWGETAITFNSAPPVGAALGSSGGWSTTGYKSIALSAGYVHAGLNSIEIETSSTTNKSFHSREGANRPQLVVTYTSAGPAGACGAMKGTAPHISKVIWIWFENKGFGNITPAAAPYFNQIKGECGYASNYKSVTTCTSLPEYIASTSGSAQGICDNGSPSTHPLSVNNVFRQIVTAGKTWRSYQEGMTANCMRSNTGRYAVRHNPAAYYVSTADSSSCASNDVPLPASPSFASNFTFVEPDLCNSMHDCSVSTGDAWLKGILPKVLGSSDYQAGNTAVFITFDEGGGTGGEVLFTIALSPYTAPGTVSATAFNHYSLLWTLQRTLGLPCLLNSCGAADMRPAFGMG
jgi:hypothetical protein